jgi:formamidopyrimidine-DNA glycosylase
VPELPDVERFKSEFVARAVGRRIRSIDADPTILRNTTVEDLRAALAKTRVVGAERLGKWLLCRTDGPTLVLHFGITGFFPAPDVDAHRHDRLTIDFDDGTRLVYRNMRKLGGVWLVRTAEDERALLGAVGPDARDLERATFLARLERRRGAVKSALMDQSLIAGIGNILADEILWQARLHPHRRVDSLTRDERARLYRALRHVVDLSVTGGDHVESRRTWLSRVRGLPDARCPRCRTPLARTVTAGRTTYFCPHCQQLEATMAP